MGDRIKFFFNRLRERLWVKPLIMCILSIAGAFIAKLADDTGLREFVPEISTESLETLLTILSNSMLVIATFAVASMVSAYASASTTATPRSFSLIISDDVSQNALSSYIGAFIFSIVARIVLENGFYDKPGRFVLFALTLLVFIIVIITFVRWTDGIARLGRLGTTIDKVEMATAAALSHRKNAPTLGGMRLGPALIKAHPIYPHSVGYLQRVDVSGLQACAEKLGLRIQLLILPGVFCTADRPLAMIATDSNDVTDIDMDRLAQEFIIGDDRLFDEDPRFGLIVLSEIASRALSPAVNDPGTAIDIICTFVRLFTQWRNEPEEGTRPSQKYNRIEVPEISLEDMFDDAFGAIGRDGAGLIEVVARLQKALASLAALGDARMQEVSMQQARRTLARAETALDFPRDREIARHLTEFALRT